jgi:hypothetical protein
MALVEDSQTGVLTTANMRMETSVAPTSNLRFDLALIGHAQWAEFPATYESLGATIPGAGSGSGPAGRLFNASVDGASGNLSYLGDVDRLSLTFWLGNLEIVMGRQAVSWGRTMVFQPLDVLGPFSLLSFDTEAKPGIDALRVRVPIFADGTLDIVANQDAKGDESAYAARMTMLAGPAAELGLTGGRVRDEWMAGLDGVWSFEQWSLRWESLYLPERGGMEGVVATVGFERFFLNGDMQIFLEILHDSRGASGPDELVDVFTSAAFGQGRMKVPSQNAAALGLRHQLAALWLLNLSIVADLQSPSGLGFVQITRSLSDNVSMDIFVYTSAGASWEIDSSTGLRPGSSFGSFPSMAALYLRAYL